MPPEKFEPQNESQTAYLKVNLPERPNPALQFADAQNKELDTARAKYWKAVGDCSVFPLSDEAKIALRIIGELATKHFKAINDKYGKIRTLIASSQSRIETSYAELQKTQKELKELSRPFGIVRELTGMRKVISKNGVAEVNLMNDLQERIKALSALADPSVPPEYAMYQIAQMTAPGAGVRYDFSAVDAAIKDVNGKADKWEQSIDAVDQAVGMVSKSIPWGPEVYISMKSLGMVIGGVDSQEVMNKNIRQYLEIRLGKGARVALAGAEHHEEILLVLKESDKLAEVMPELVPLLEEAAPAAADQAEDNASFLTKKIMKGFIKRKFPKLAAAKGITADLVDGASITDAAANNRRNLLRATKKSNAALKQGTNVAVDAAADKLQTTDYKLEEFRKNMKEKLAQSGIDPVLQAEIEQVLVDTLKERLEAAKKQN